MHNSEEFSAVLSQTGDATTLLWLLYYRIRSCEKGLATDSIDALLERGVKLCQSKKAHVDAQCMSMFYTYCASRLTEQGKSEAREFAQKAYELSKKHGDEIGLVRALFARGSSYMIESDFEKARESYVEITDSYAAVDLVQTINAQINISSIFQRENRNEESLRYLIEAQKSVDKATFINTNQVAIECNGNAELFHTGYVRSAINVDKSQLFIDAGYYYILSETGLHSESMVYAQRALSNPEVSKSPLYLLMWLNNIAVGNIEIGNTEEAISTISQAEEVNLTVQNQVMGAYLMLNKGRVYILQKRYNEALPLLDESIHKFEKQQNHEEFLTCKQYKAELLNQLQKHQESVAELQQFVETPILQETLQIRPELCIEYAIALYKINNAQAKQALHLVNIAIEGLENIGANHRRVLAEKQRAQLLSDMGDSAAAFNSLLLYSSLQQQNITAAAREKAQVLSVLYALDSERYKNSILVQQSARKDQELHHLQVQITMKANALLQQIQAVNALKKDLMSVFTDIDKAEDILKAIRKKLNATPVLQQDWNQLIAAFEEVHPNFVSNLVDKFPSISKTESKVAVLVLAGLSNEQIADMLFVTVRAVEKHRLSIRKKLNIHRSENIVKVLSEIATK